MLIDRGIRLGDLFNNHEEIKNLLKSQMPGAREGLIDGLFESSVKLIYVSNYSYLNRDVINYAEIYLITSLFPVLYKYYIKKYALFLYGIAVDKKCLY